jgi:hypothetical protein
MVSLAAWNIRGLNHSLKQKEVRQLICDNHLNFCAVLETHVAVKNLGKFCGHIFRSWDWISNGNMCARGTRIIVGWNSLMMDVMVLFKSDQVIHMKLVFKNDKRVMFCSIVYANNYYMNRRILWRDLMCHKTIVKDDPWVIMGDFNTTLSADDSSCGSSKMDIGMHEFRECIESLEVMDVKGVGLH